MLADINPEGLEAFTRHFRGEVVGKTSPLISDETNGTTFYDSIKFGVDVDNAIQSARDRLKKLQSLELHILDNTCRETTVASLCGHTLDDKYVLADIVKACGIKNVILGTFSPVQRRVDDQFATSLLEPDMQKRYAGISWFAFAEARSDKLSDQLIGVNLTEARKRIADFADLPVGLERAKEYGNVHLPTPLLLPYLILGFYTAMTNN